MITKKLHSLLGPAIIFVLALSVYFAYRHVNGNLAFSGVSNDLENHCTFVNQLCEFTLSSMPAQATFSAPPIAEDSITLTFSLPPSVDVESVWIEGVNMYMGKIPVLMSQTGPGHWEGWFMLGSCSEPVMRWRMLINIKGRQAPAILYFTSTR